MIFLLITVFFMYIVPAVISYLGIRHQHKNEWEGLEPGIADFVMVFTPLLNWGYSIFIVMSVSFDALGEAMDKAEESKTNRRIKNKKIGSKFFRLK